MEQIGKLTVTSVMAMLFAIITALIVASAYNMVVPMLFGLPKLAMWQAYALLILFSIVRPDQPGSKDEANKRLTTHISDGIGRCCGRGFALLLLWIVIKIFV